MKTNRKVLLFMALLVVFALTISLVACGLKDSNEPDNSVYIIQYTDETGTHKVETKYREAFTFSEVPTKEGYNFVGLFDSKVGGTQYTDEYGASLMVFTDKKNMILFPQFTPIKYSVILNFDGAEHSNYANFYEVDYDSEIPALPRNITKDKMFFIGWFTEPNGKGMQVADENGFFAKKNILNKNSYDVSSTEIKLYAYFTYDDCNISIILPGGNVINQKVAYNSPINQIEVPVGNQYVVRFTTDYQHLNEFKGNITDDIRLYAVLGYKISFDTKTKHKIDSIYECEGKEVALPVPSGRTYDKFLGWEYEGQTYNDYFELKNKNVMLTAKWESNGWTYIYTAEDFLAISKNLAGKYCLENDITLNKYQPRDNYIWNCAANTDYTSLPQGFTGILDGQNHTITYDLYITIDGKSSSKDTGFGLFACATNATFKNLNIQATISGREHVDNLVRIYRNYIGAIAGWTVNCTYENIKVSGSIRQQQCAQLAGTGGVCGYARNCSFKNCSNSASIFSGGRYVPAAGISASNVNSNYVNCSNKGTISVSQGTWVGIGGAWTQKGDIYCTRL